MIIVLFGVSGAGKTTIGRQLARELAWPFHDGDDYHTSASRDRMASGVPLTDADRWPWLAAIRDLISGTRAARQNAVIACSALARAHRDYLRQPGVRFVYLKGTPDLLRERLRARRGHFFPPGLLESQLEALEAPRGGVVVDVAKPPRDVVREIRRRLGLSG